MTIASNPGASDPAEVGIPGFPVTTVGPTGLQFIDGLLAGKKWDSPIIYYSDPDSVSDYQSNYPANRAAQGFHQLSAQQMAAVHLALSSAYLTDKFGYPGYSVEGFTNLGVSYFDGGTGYSHPAVRQQHRRRHRLCLLSRHPCRRRRRLVRRLGRQPGAGQLRQLHRHPRDRPCARAEARARDRRLRGAAVRHRLDGILGDDLQVLRRVRRRSTSTNETWGYAQTFMMYDIAALQHMYGADFDDQRRQHHLHLEPDHRRVLRQRRAGDRAGRQPHLPDHLGRQRLRHLRPVELLHQPRDQPEPRLSLDLLARPSSPISAAARTAATPAATSSTRCSTTATRAR